MKSKYIILISILLCTSCKKFIDIELQKEPTKIVLNALVYPDSVLSVHVSQSIPITSTETDVTLPGALVELFANNAKVAELSHEDGGNFTLSDNELIPNVEYRIDASYSSFEPVFTYFTIPAKPEITKVDTSFNPYNDPSCVGCSPMEQMSCSFDILNCDASTREYFLVQFSQTSTDYYIDTILDYTNNTWETQSDSTVSTFNLYLSSNDPSVKITIDDYGYVNEVLPDGYSYSGNILLFEKPEGANHLKINIKALNLSGSNKAQLDMWVTRVEESYYEFLLSLARYKFSEDDFLAEKVTVYSNVENGLGIVSGANTIHYFIGERSTINDEN